MVWYRRRVRSWCKTGHAGQAPRLLVGSWLGVVALVVPTSLWSHTVAPAASNLSEGVTRVAAERTHIGGRGSAFLPTSPNDQVATQRVALPESPPVLVLATRESAPAIGDARATGDSPDDGVERVQDEPSELEEIASIGRETWIYAKADAKSDKLGYLRFAARVRREVSSRSAVGCSGGWYRVSPYGYVCNNGRSATIDLSHPLLQVVTEGVNRSQSLPYVYMRPSGAPVLVHTRLAKTSAPPGSLGTTAKIHPGSDGLATLDSARPWVDGTLEAFGFPRAETGTLPRIAPARSGFSLLGLYEQEKKTYGLTPDMDLIDLSVLRPAEPSAFRGIPLDDKTTLPVAFAMDQGTFLYQGDPARGTLRPVRRVDYREAIPVTGAEVRSGGSRFLVTQNGQYVAGSKLRIIAPRTDFPDFAKSGRVWVDVSISEQSLVAYDGTRPVYVTLVSTGKEGLAAPEGSTPTKRGTFTIWSKHVTATMSGDDDEEPYEMRDVPWVQYFSGGYALHAAYWHDGFGAPRSHGCVNLSPIEARWLFHFTTPGVPMKWHGVNVRPSDASVVEVRE
jgi:lipoprotein-anchoring transpeptidase ErfK/SrfK